jgi:ElaB/YqjD/DUF883 family membrane-anchored ribosome-binding protein
MADEPPKRPRPAKPLKTAAVRATPGANGAAPPRQSRPKPAKPLKGPTVETSIIENPKTASPSNAKAGTDDKPGAAQLLKDGAAKLTKEAGDKARSYAEDGKARAGGVLDELSKMMSEAAGTVDEKVGAQYGQYARSAAEAVSGFSDSIKSKDIDELIDDARAFVKKSPAIAIGTAAVLGFVLVRLIKSGLDANDRDQA